MYSGVVLVHHAVVEAMYGGQVLFGRGYAIGEASPYEAALATSGEHFYTFMSGISVPGAYSTVKPPMLVAPVTNCTIQRFNPC